MKTRKGATLVEIVVGSMIIAVTAALVGNILLASLSATTSDQTRFTITNEAAALKEELKNYVTADTSITQNAPGSPPWHLPEDSSCADCWALSEGVHDATTRLPAKLRDTYKATLKYTVTDEIYHGRKGQNVKIETNWENPNP